MTKRQLIDEIVSKNHTAQPGFLAQFNDEELREYLGHLRWVKQPRLSGDARRFEKYFRNPARPAPASPTSQPQAQAVQTVSLEDAEETAPQARPLPDRQVSDGVAEGALALPADQAGLYMDETAASQEELAYQTELEAEAALADTDDADSSTEQKPFADAEPQPQSWLF